jgi:hypothetical protein
MNDIFHERHMNNIIAADREQNIHVRPTTSTRIGSRASGPKSQRPNSDRSLEHQLGVRCVQTDAFEVPGGLAANSWKNVNSKNRAWSVSDRNGISPGSNFGVLPSTTQGEGTTPGARRMSVETIGMVWNHKFARVLLIAKLRLECERRGFCAGANGRSRRGQC